MANNKVKNPPEMRKDLLYDDWKRELDIWCDFTDIPKEKQGPDFSFPYGKGTRDCFS